MAETESAETGGEQSGLSMAFELDIGLRTAARPRLFEGWNWDFPRAARRDNGPGNAMRSNSGGAAQATGELRADAASADAKRSLWPACDHHDRVTEGQVEA